MSKGKKDDYGIIKSKYGEKMAQLCRTLFPEILDVDGLLPKVLMDTFYPSRDVYNAIMYNDLKEQFKDLIFFKSGIDEVVKKEVATDKTPFELMEEEGYTLYECYTYEDILEFKKYYSYGEILCTFDDPQRIDECHVFFAVKNNVDEIKREDFINPQREDEYSLSVVSIQFNRENFRVSIKSRYNHTVKNPDATYGNDLDKLAKGLKYSFEKVYGFKRKIDVSEDDFWEDYNFVKADDGRFYLFNHFDFLNDIYICPNNMIIKNGIPKQLPPEKFTIIDSQYILDLRTGQMWNYDGKNDSFLDTIQNVESYKMEKVEGGKKITYTVKDGEDIEIVINKNNNIVKYKNNNIIEIGDRFLFSNEELEELEIKNVIKIGDDFCHYNNGLKELELDNVLQIGDYALTSNTVMEKFKADKLIKVGDDFLCKDFALRFLNLPNLEKLSEGCFYQCENLEVLYAFKLKKIEKECLTYASKLKKLYVPNLEEIGNDVLTYNDELSTFFAPRLCNIGEDVLYCNTTLEFADFSSLLYCEDGFLNNHPNISKFSFPNLIMCSFLFRYLSEKSISIFNRNDKGDRKM